MWRIAVPLTRVNEYKRAIEYINKLLDPLSENIC